MDAGGGNGIFKQLEQAGVPFTGIREMFVTHAHTDHILGAIWVIRKIATFAAASCPKKERGFQGILKQCLIKKTFFYQ